MIKMTQFQNEIIGAVREGEEGKCERERRHQEILF
jgi:hypothetical protein